MAGRRPPWGWHQLDANWARRLVADAGVGRGDLVLDVGAGTGALTLPLVESGARVLAIERHPDRLGVLRERFSDVVTVIDADAADLRLPRRPFHVVANPPFAVSSALLRRLLHPGSRLLGAHLVLPDAVARRWSGPGAPAANRWQRHHRPLLGPVVPRRAFEPPAPMPCRVLVIRPR